MEIIINTIEFFLHLGNHIADLTAQYGVWVYLILFLIIFCETGVVVMPFLPGDSLLFVIGALSASGKLDIKILIPLLILGAILGYWTNYFVGSRINHKVVDEHKLRFVRQKHIEQTHQFYEKYGPKALVVARFIPIMRTFAPFLAGVGKMNYAHFQFYNIISAFLWIPSIILLGYFFGNIPMIRDNFTYVVFTIIIVSILPIGFEYFKHQKKSETLRK
jgi:membrane-associated protein